MKLFERKTDIRDLRRGDWIRIQFGEESHAAEVLEVHRGEGGRAFHVHIKGISTRTYTESNLIMRYWVHTKKPSLFGRFFK